LNVALTLASTIIILGNLLFKRPSLLVLLVQIGLFFGCLFCFLLSGIVHVESGIGVLIILIPQLLILYDINPRYLQIERIHVNIKVLDVLDEGLYGLISKGLLTSSNINGKADSKVIPGFSLKSNF